MSTAAAQETDNRWHFADGDRITDDLTATRLLGGGSSYEAYLAFDDVTLSPVVVKVVRPDRVDDASSLRSLGREVQALAAVNHPVVVRGLRHELDGPRPHVVLEAVDGPRLSTLVRRHGPLEPYQYLPLAIDVASALHYLGGLGWVHLDIKPSNVIMGAPARLIDLSVARPVADAGALDHVIGTDDYLAPEQADPPRSGRPGPASDVWGLGTTLFHAIAGHRAFDDADPDHPDPRRRHPRTWATPYDLPAGVAPPVAEIVLAMLAHDPGDRPAPREVAEALEPVLSDLPRQRLAGFKVR